MAITRSLASITVTDPYENGQYGVFLIMAAPQLLHSIAKSACQCFDQLSVCTNPLAMLQTTDVQSGAYSAPRNSSNLLAAVL